MAIIQKSIWGQLSGTIGNNVIRNRNGKSVVYSLPRRYKLSDSDKLKVERNKFGLTVKFAKFINNIPLLKLTWKKADAAGSNAYQKIIKHNAGKNTSIMFTKKNTITPPGESLIIKEAVLDDSGIHLILDLGVNYSNNFVIPFNACSIICFFNPLNKDEIYYSFCSITQIVDNGIAGSEFSLTFSPDPEYLKLINKYSNSILYIALVKENSLAGKLVWTHTAATEM
jgi:hypothetical protein